MASDEPVPDGLVDLATGNPDPAFLPDLGAALRAAPAHHVLYGSGLGARREWLDHVTWTLPIGISSR